MTKEQNISKPENQVSERGEISTLPKMSRRNFLQGALVGVAAVGSGCAGSLTSPGKPVAQGQAATPTSKPASGANQGQAYRQQPLVSPLKPGGVVETWIEPWVWRPSDWPGQQLHLNVVENENFGLEVSGSNPSPFLFSYGGITPGPTIRMRGDEILYIKLRNLLGQDFGKTAVGPNPDPNELTPGLNPGDIPADVREDFCLGEHANGLHAAHVTNLHTHGLHVRPGKNPDGTHSDNVLLRVMSQADFRRRQQRATDPTCQFLRVPGQFDISRTEFLRVHEQVGEVDSEFQLGNVQRKKMGQEGKPRQPHPPGTHWYHPHAHGATHNQVSSGMAGFLIVEGDIDEAINRHMTRTDQDHVGIPNPDPEQKTGPYDYRERLIFIQRVLQQNAASDPDNPNITKEVNLRGKKEIPPVGIINGSNQPRIITMRPGAIERWRVLNGSVDGRGFKRFMVLDGQYDLEANQQLAKYDSDTQQWKPVTLQQIEDDKQQLYQLAMDGITLVTVEDGKAKYTIKDLVQQNYGTQNPLAGPIPSGENPNAAMLRNYQSVFKDGTSIKNCYVRPNEVYLGPANRTDVFFKAPTLPANSGGKVYTILAKAVVVHADNYQQNLQKAVTKGEKTLISGPEDMIVAYVFVDGEQVEGGDFDVLSLRDVLPEVPPYLQPVGDDELRIPLEEASARSDVEQGLYRTRTITYSGWGSQDFPLISTDSQDPSAQNFQAFIDNDKKNNDGKLENLIYAQHDGVYVLLPSAIRTMAVNGRKFDPSDPERPRMLVDSAEEWVLYNNSTMLWGYTDTSKHPQPGQYGGHYVSYPVSRTEGQTRFDGDKHFQIVTKGVDHPFHIHQNPFWVTRIEIPDENGDLHNILDEPRWQDTVWIPRHRGRVVFRSRFPDYVGVYVNHCHILLHEDNGMMQVVEATPFADQTNYDPKSKLASRMSAQEVSSNYPRLALEEAYQQSAAFIDPDPVTGQTYPGFVVEPPILEG